MKRQRPGDDKDYLAFLRELPCCVSGYRVTEPHHLMRSIDSAPKGTGRKHEDRWAIPVTREVHNQIHRHGNDEEWLALAGIDGRALAQRLWSIWNNEDPDNRHAAALRAVGRARRVERK